MDTGSNPVRLKGRFWSSSILNKTQQYYMNKNNLTNLEMLYIIYCKKITGFMIDPLCAIVAYYIVDNPLDSPFLTSFVYMCVYIIFRIPLMIYYNDV